MASSSKATTRPATKQRVCQHKHEAFWFYRFLSIVYDPLSFFAGWGDAVRYSAVEPLDLSNPDLTVVDVGGGTGLTSLAVVRHVHAKNVTVLDQSPHQLAQAKKKPQLKDCTFIEGDAEDLPFPTDYADRYVSAGSIEYWPDPQRGVTEAYRVLKPGGMACIIGPVYPTHWLSRLIADAWMLFPKEEEYVDWFRNAGFEDVKLKRVGPSWYRGVRRHGLIMGCSVTGVKRVPGNSPLKLTTSKEEDLKKPPPMNKIFFFIRFLIANLATAYFTFVVPFYMAVKNLIVPSGRPI